MARPCFIIISRPRAGTTLLVDSLNQHPEIVCYDEVFHYKVQLRRRYSPGGTAFADGGDAAAYLREHIFNESDKACGFKMLYDQAKRTNLRDYLTTLPDLVVFHLIRDNTLACEASGAAAYATGKWHSHRQGRPETEPVIRLDEQQLWRQFRIHDACFRETEYRFRHNRVVQVFYDDLLSSFEKTMARLYAVLGAAPFVPEMKLEKMSRKPLQERIANWDALKKVFADTLYARFFSANNP